MNWNRKELRKGAWNTVFKRGTMAWLALVAVCFIFAFLGVDEFAQSTFVNGIDKAIGLDTSHVASNVEILKDYAVNTPIVKDVPFIHSDFVIGLIDVATKSQTWIIKLLGANAAYLERNTGEVIIALLLSAFIMMIVHFFIQSAAIVGKNRYAMECRYSDKVSINRMFAPFHFKHLLRLIWTMFVYKVVLFLWNLTIVGGIYKFYQYRMIPYLVAENQTLSWKEAKALSKEMTNGYKWKMFVTDLSCIPVMLLKLVPIAGLLVAVPFDVEIDVEMYFHLRKRIDSEAFVERAFDGAPYCKGIETAVPVYLLQDAAVEVPKGIKIKSEYRLTDFIFFFFSFCFVGWVWEVMLHIVRDHELVNRGTMYGPWLPIYGVGGVVIIFLLDRFKADKLKLFLMSMGICGVLEYIASWILDFFFNSHYWNYKKFFLNLNGRICLVGLLAFGIGSLFGVYIAAPKLSRFMHKKSRKTQILICAVLSTVFIIDLICCALFGFNAGSGVGGTYN